MSTYVLSFQDIDKTDLPTVGGKGANLGELSKLAEVRVPAGFCISTRAFRRILEETPSLSTFVDQLASLQLADRVQISQLSSELRRAIEAAPIPDDVTAEITQHLAELGADQAYAIRSSATAEDLPTASFAGQQDSYLNIVGTAAILQHIRKCWASLFTERAILYRLQAGFDHRQVQLAVVVQQMVFPQVAGILFTADPVTGHRKVSSIDASFGLGEALVAGLVNVDTYTVSEGQIIERKIATKQLAIYADPTGGTKRQPLPPGQQQQPALTDAQILQLAQIGRTLEAHFGQPQDIEWCLVDDTFYIVQSRPITTLYPIPAAGDGQSADHTESVTRVYVSVGHQQMMTDAIKPLGVSFWQLTAARPMFQAGGRLFVDVTQELASPTSRAMILNGLGRSDPLIRDALETLLAREEFNQAAPVEQPAPNVSASLKAALSPQPPPEYDPTLVPELIQRSQQELAVAQQEIQTKSGVALFDFILEDLQRLKQSLAAPQSMGVIIAAMNAAFWLNENMEAWLGEKNVADTLAQSVPYNITAEMGLALLEVADVLRLYPQVVAFLQQAKDPDFLADLEQFEGGAEARDALNAYLDRYGMRCPGEIDITRTRWRENPTALLPLLLSNIKNFAPGAGQQKFEQGQQEALQKEQELLERLRQLPDGAQKAAETKRRIELLRGYAGYREYPKYAMVNRYFVYRQALLQEAARLVQVGVLQTVEDCYYLTFAEFREVVRSHQLDSQLIRQRQDEYRRYEKLTPPRVITSDGEIVVGSYKRENLPAQALAGLPVSAGVVEGRARVVLALEDADLAPGDILVTVFTDPSWTPLFVAISGLVTEVGGLMTHGAVIAREYGLPAVVGVEQATKLIQDGQRIRVHGTAGYVEILNEADTTQK